MKNFLRLLVAATCMSFQLFGATPVDPLGIMTEATLSGNNPITFAKWKAGDQYRLVFITSATRTAQSASIATYNNWVQALADASPYGIGSAQGVTWKAIGSTDTVDARDNTSTNPEVNGLGCPVYLLNGSTKVFQGNSHMWGGGSAYAIINLTEQGGIFTGWPWTGTYIDGTRAIDHDWSFNALGGTVPNGSELHVHQGNSSSKSAWVWRYWAGDPPLTQHSMYALSDPITLVAPEPVKVPVQISNEGGAYSFIWQSQPGKTYDLVSATNLGVDPAQWPVYQGHEGIAPSGTGINTLSGVSATGSKRFFSILER